MIKDWFLLINKPIWFSSFKLILILRKIFNIKKIWHTWTLDPLATGLMLIWIWKACKFISYHRYDTKSYKAKIIW